MAFENRAAKPESMQKGRGLFRLIMQWRVQKYKLCITPAKRTKIGSSVLRRKIDRPAATKTKMNGNNDDVSTRPVKTDELIMQSDNNLVDKPSRETMGDPSDVVSISDVAPRSAVQQLTGFIDDAAVVPASLPILKDPESGMISATQEQRVHTIIDVLSRPVKVASGTWSESDVRDALLEDLTFPETIFDQSVNVIDKLNFFTYFRADVCIRVIVNANTFQCGKLLGYFTPFEDLVGNRDVASAHTSAYTAFPYVLIDASTGNVAELRIPYVAPYSSFRLTDGVGTIGNFKLRVLNNLRLDTATYTVFAWFTNISVDIPSGRESQIGGETARLMRDLRSYLRRGGDPSAYRAQVADEGEQKSRGIISTTMHRVSEVSSMAAGIPSLAPVAAPLSWVTNFGAQLAEYFGLSKPVNMSTPCTLINVPAKGFTNFNGVDNSIVLASSATNAVESRGDCFGSSMDDMDITAIVKHRCYVQSFEMTKLQVSGTKLVSYPVSPGLCGFSDGTYTPTTTAFVTSMFQLWRGGLRYKIQAAKTAYHSGRIKIIYLPSSVTDVADDPQQAYNWVLDLRNSSEVEFTIPYNNILEWSTCRLTSGSNVSLNSSIGTIRIEVLNELRAPDSVTDSIEFNIWIAGESDLQFAIPSFQEYVPSLPDTSSFVAQVLGSQQDRGFNDMTDKPGLFGMNTPDKIIPCKITIGEITTNLRAIIRRFALEDVFDKPDSSDLLLGLPVNYFKSLYDPSSDNLAEYSLTPLDYVSFLYRFYRGGTRYKFMVGSTATNGLNSYQECILATAFPSDREIVEIPEALYQKFFRASSAFLHRVYSVINPILEVTIPFYSQSIIRPLVGADVPQPENLTSNSLLYKLSGPAASEVTILRAAADDFSFGWLIGPPRLRDRNTGFGAIDVITDGGVSPAITDNVITFLGTISPLTPLQPGNYDVLSSLPATYEVLLNDTSVIQATPFRITVQTDGSVGIPCNYAGPASSVDQLGTSSLWNALGNVALSLA